MSTRRDIRRIFSAILFGLAINQAQAAELLHFVEAKDYGPVMEDATGVKIADDGVVYVTSEEKGTLLKIIDGNIEAIQLTPDVFKDSDLGGIDLLPDGRLVVVNEGSGQVGILDAELKPLEMFSESGSGAGELDEDAVMAAAATPSHTSGSTPARSAALAVSAPTPAEPAVFATVLSVRMAASGRSTNRVATRISPVSKGFALRS